MQVHETNGGSQVNIFDWKNEFSALLNHVRVARQLFDGLSVSLVRSCTISADPVYDGMSLLFKKVFEVEPAFREQLYKELIRFTRQFAINCSFEDHGRFSAFVSVVADNIKSPSYIPALEALRSLGWDSLYQG
jgi:hypothetical protein